MDLETRLTLSLIARYEQAGHWGEQRLWDIVDQVRRSAPDRVAVRDERAELTYVELVAQADRIALGLLETGVGKGDVVSVQLPNRLEFVILLLALERIGAIMNPIVPSLRQRELREILSLGRARVLVVPDTYRGYSHAHMALELAESLPELRRIIVTGRAPPGTLAWESMVDTPWETRMDTRVLDHLRPGPNDVTELAFTSGTTGQPKGILHTHNTLLCIVRSTIRRQRLSHTDVFLAATPVGHNAGYLWGVRVALQSGATTVLQESWDASAMVRLVQQHGVTFTMGATTFLIDLLNVPGLTERDIPSLRNFTCAGSNVPRAVAAEMVQRFPGRLCRAFGMTEHGHSTATDLTSPIEKVLDTDGSPQPEMEVEIVDDGGQRVPPHVEGHLRVRGPFNFVGYLQGREFTTQFFDERDFFETGDLATLDTEGYLRLTGRTKEVVVRGGEKVPVKAIEDVLMLHPRIMNVVIVAVPHARLGEQAVACVRPRRGEHVTLEDVRQFLADQQVSRPYWPEGVVQFEEFPLTDAGKVEKRVLREVLLRRTDSA